MTREDFKYKYSTDESFRKRIDEKYGKCFSELILSLVERRQHMKMTTLDLAYTSDVSLSTIANIENFKQFPTYQTLNKIASVLGVNININVSAIE